MSVAQTLLLTVLAARQPLEADVSPDTRTGWTKGARAHPLSPLELVVGMALPRSGLAQLEHIHATVSDPTSSTYGQHISNERVHALVAPSAADVDTVSALFASHNIAIEAATPNSDMLVARTTVGAVEAALGCEYFAYTHAQSGSRALRTPHYSLPAHVSRAVSFVSPTVRLPPTASPRAVAMADAKQPDGLFNTPKSLRKLYAVDDVVGKAATNKQAVTGFLGQHFSQGDLNEFNLLYMKDNRGQKMATKGDGATGLLSGVEAMLDAEYVTGLGANITSEFWGFIGVR